MIRSDGRYGTQKNQRRKKRLKLENDKKLSEIRLVQKKTAKAQDIYMTVAALTFSVSVFRHVNDNEDKNASNVRPGERLLVRTSPSPAKY